MCKKPGKGGWGCRQCLPCRINGRRIWQTRLMLESSVTKLNCFVTLTYSPKFCPINGSLVKEDLRNWLKRLRKFIAPVAIRYYAVGEYGEESLRPHYHALLFGLPPCQLLGTWGPTGRSKEICLCQSCQTIHRTWMLKGESLGRIDCARCEPDSMAYVCGYTVKKMTKETDPRLPAGCIPEFGRMSKGLGVGAIPILAKAEKENALLLHGATGDVTSVIGTSKGLMPLGRFLRGKLRKEVGFYEGDPSKSTTAGKKSDFEAVQRVRQRIADAQGISDVSSDALYKLERQIKIYKASKVEAKFKIFGKRSSL